MAGLFERALDFIERRGTIIDWLWRAGAAAVSFGLPAWAAHATDWLREYGPIAWVGAGFAGLLIVTLVFYFSGLGKSQWQIARWQRRLAETSIVNPLDATFEKKRIRVTDLSPPITGIIRGKTFVDCEIIGPVNVFFDQCTFLQNGGEGVDGLIIKPAYRPKNGFAFQNCNFTRCKFYLMTFMVPENTYQSFMHHGWTGLNWITDLPGQLPLPIPGKALPWPELTDTDKL